MAPTRKKRRTAYTVEQPHPYGVQPSGNALLPGAARSIREPGLGRLAVLGDELLVELLGWLDARALCAAAQASRALYVYAHHEPVWKALVVADFGSPLGADATDPDAKGSEPCRFVFRRSWKATYLAAAGWRPQRNAEPVSVAGIYSDWLFQFHLCATARLRPEWLATNNIDRRSGLSLEDFRREYEEPGRPVILTDVVTKWPAFERWSPEDLAERFGDVVFDCGEVNMRLRDFFAYQKDTIDERPLYLFDKHFADRAPQMGAEFSVPDYFGEEDLFGLLGADGRPDYRWLIIGKAGSGSTFHVDPNRTSAWNAVIRGSKKWLLLPPSVTPPGVFPSEDGAEVVVPFSTSEWFVNNYAALADLDCRPMEGICREGEVMFIPHGWWHTVVNIEDSIAITQNYVGRHNLVPVLRFLRNKPHCISGCCGAAKDTLCERFEAEIRTAHPDKFREFDDDDRSRKDRVNFWREAKEGATSFSFGF